MKYRKKPEIVDAFKITQNTKFPDWFDYYLQRRYSDSQGCYAVKDNINNIKVVTKEYFEKTYEKVDE